ncbi:glycine betaine ABC transporter substrate-binding protein [Nocardia sp. NPDC050406]|uniref:glycine betaine ABC transporter substrate-binding protein n=1 Tax=Nocardia sp. NPDC050406 TaxID=3364318 RepID=UPI0037A4B7EF
MALAAVTASCADDREAAAIVVGAGTSDQARMVAEIYAGALARAGAKTEVRDNLGGRADYLADLDAATITLTSDDTGDLLRTLNSAADAAKPDQVLPALYGALPEGLIVSDPADGTDLRPTVVTTRAAQLPTSLDDLAPRCAELTVGVNTGPSTDPLRPALNLRLDIVDPLHNTYGCTFTRITEYASDSEVQEALQTNLIQAGVLSMPPSFLKGGSADVMSEIGDPAYAFRAQQVIPLIRKGALDNDQVRKLNYVAGELTTADLADMVRQVRDNRGSAKDLARTWLDAHSL